MIELIAVCVLTTGQLFTIPPDWKAVEVRAEGYTSITYLDTRYCPNGCPPPKGYVKLNRKIGVGERVKLPDGCEVEAENG